VQQPEIVSADSRGARSLPTGVVTFLFTDVEGSTRLLQQHPTGYRSLLERHAAIIRAALTDHDGLEVSTEGDAFFAVFRSPADAVSAAVDAQRRLAATDWPEGTALRVRMGLHTGEGTLGGDNYAGIDVHRAARICGAGHGGQVVLSASTREHVEGRLPAGVDLRDLGVHQLRDLDRPERLWQLAIDGLPADFPPLRAAASGRVPLASTSFIGREGAVADVRRLAADSRLVTLTGPGGAGKTRLAMAATAEPAAAWPEGAYFVALETIHQAELVPSAIARVLGVRETADVPAEEALARDLADRRLLLVLDNFEQPLVGAGFVDRLLKVAPQLRVLVTSRAPLRLYGEQEYQVPPLALPELDRLPHADVLSRYEAVALFIARARAVRPDFDVTDANARAVAELCVRLDGLPLAIELAAARVKLLPPEAILARLGTRLDLLASTATNVPARQRTLRGVVAWSYDLLAEPGQRLLERMAIFAGGCSLDAVATVCDPDGDLGGDLLEVLSALVDHSLVRQVQSAGEPRFGLLETIRDFALERLRARPEAGIVERRYAEFVLRLVEDAEPFLETVGGEDRIVLLERDYDNVRGAMRWAIDAGEADLALRIGAATWRFWQREGLVREGRAWLEEALRLPGAAEPTLHRAKALSANGSLAYWQHDLETTSAMYAEALDLYRSLGDDRGLAMALFNAGFVPMLAGEHDRARALFAEALEGFRRLGDAAHVTESAFVLGYDRLLAGDAAAALPMLRESVSGQGHDPRRLADNTLGLAQAERAYGNTDEALRLARRSLQLLETTPDAGLTVTAIEVVAACEADLGNNELACVLFSAGVALRPRYGGGPLAVMLLGDAHERATRALAPEVLRAAVARGATLSLEEARALAMAHG